MSCLRRRSAALTCQADEAATPPTHQLPLKAFLKRAGAEVGGSFSYVRLPPSGRAEHRHRHVRWLAGVFAEEKS